MPLFYDSKVFENIPREDLGRIKKKIDWLWVNREYIKHLPLGENLAGFYKLRVGNYRVLYEYAVPNDEIRICLIGTRDTIYRDADKKYN
jgi:mRNA interferase RelE/StbE